MPLKKNVSYLPVVTLTVVVMLIGVVIFQQLVSGERTKSSSSASEFSTAMSTDDNLRTDSSSQTSSTNYNFSQKCCGDCVEMVENKVWEGAPDNTCQGVVTCKNGGPKRRDSTSRPIYTSDDDVIECFTRDELIEQCNRPDTTCDFTRFINWPINDNQVYCDFKYWDELEACDANAIDPPDWEKISKEVCGCGYEYQEYVIDVCEDCGTDLTCSACKSRNESKCSKCRNAGGECEVEMFGAKGVLFCKGIMSCLSYVDEPVRRPDPACKYMSPTPTMPVAPTDRPEEPTSIPVKPTALPTPTDLPALPACSQTGLLSGRDTGFGNKYTCLAKCPDGRTRSWDRAAGYSQAQCNSLATQFCCQ